MIFSPFPLFPPGNVLAVRSAAPRQNVSIAITLVGLLTSHVVDSACAYSYRCANAFVIELLEWPEYN